jgi:hypothetical protein
MAARTCGSPHGASSGHRRIFHYKAVLPGANRLPESLHRGAVPAKSLAYRIHPSFNFLSLAYFRLNRAGHQIAP